MVLQITPADIAYQKAHKDDDRSGALHTMTNPIPHVVHFIQLMYAVELTYTVLITTTKFSILLFYRRVFMNQASSQRFRIVWYAITIWTFLWGISTFFAAAFQCSPASFYWTKYTRKTQGTCIDLTLLLLVTASTNIVTDVALLILPMPLVWKLNIERPQKFAVSGIFLLGGLIIASVCIASIIRAPYLNQVVTVDPQWTSVNASIWSVIEPGVGIICASLPSMGPILRKAFPLHISSDREPRKLNFLSSSSWKKGTSQSNVDIEKRQPSNSSWEFVVHKGMGMGQRSESTLTGQENGG
ncbi:MAG: hypothetical protein Q9215_004262 [Flavoplaca cf. flavocitrina]